MPAAIRKSPNLRNCFEPFARALGHKSAAGPRVGATMASRFEERVDAIFGFMFMAFLALMEWAMCLFFLLYAVPRSHGWLNFAAWNGVLFFGCAGALMTMYLMPKRAIRAFARKGGVYRFEKPRLLGIVAAIIGVYTALILPVAALFMVFAIPGLLFSDPSRVFPALTQFDLWSVYQSIDNFAGVFFVVIPLIVAFPWLYPKFLRILGKSLKSAFVASGIELSPEGLRVFGDTSTVIPWSWVRDVGVVVHGYAEMLVLYGSRELYALRGALDPRLPKSVKKEIEFTGEGLPIKLEYLSVRPKEVAEVIRRQFLA